MTDLHCERRCAESIARLAGNHIRRECAQQVDVSLKAPNDLVTNVDRSTERLITTLIRESFPDDLISGEEYGESVAEGRSESDRCWLIDPIDGTLNFSQGIPLFCVSIGFQIDGRTVVSAIYDPMRDELFSAAENDGAHLNGHPLQVSSVDEIATSVLVTGFPLENTDHFRWTIEQFGLLTRHCRGIRRLGSAAIDLAYVAAGRMEGFWEYDLKPWDTAGGYLLVTEAGGEVTRIDGNPFSVHDSSIAASNGHIHDEFLASLQSVM